MKINADGSRLIAIKVSTNLLRLEMGISYFYCEKRIANQSNLILHMITIKHSRMA
jgi:hypothetical protein